MMRSGLKVAFMDEEAHQNIHKARGRGDTEIYGRGIGGLVVGMESESDITIELKSGAKLRWTTPDGVRWFTEDADGGERGWFLWIVEEPTVQ